MALTHLYSSVFPIFCQPTKAKRNRRFLISDEQLAAARRAAESSHLNALDGALVLATHEGAGLRNK